MAHFSLKAYGDRLHDALCETLPGFRGHEKLYGTALASTALLVAKLALDHREATGVRRAKELQSHVRVVKGSNASVLGRLLRRLFQPADSIESIRSMHVGVSAYQKLERLKSLVVLLGYESIAIFGDCFDEVTLLDPVYSRSRCFDQTIFIGCFSGALFGFR